MIYFKSQEHLHAFAHADAHRAAWKWWNANVKRYPWLAIGHEVYAVPKGRWENVYVNFHASNFGELLFLSASLNTIGRIGFWKYDGMGYLLVFFSGYQPLGDGWRGEGLVDESVSGCREGLVEVYDF